MAKAVTVLNPANPSKKYKVGAEALPQWLHDNPAYMTEADYKAQLKLETSGDKGALKAAQDEVEHLAKLLAEAEEKNAALAKENDALTEKVAELEAASEDKK